MSEPMIKPVGYRCPKCRTFDDEFRRKTLGRDEWMHCSFCDVDTEAMFGPDDLVAVAREAYIQCGFEKECDGGAVEIVERLTGVKR
jgi:hypothetical protein